MRKLILVALLCAVSVATYAATPKKVLFIQNTGAAANSAQSDPVILNALGSTGVTIGSTTIPGLGYDVTAVQHGAENDTYTSAEYDLIFISESVTSGNPKNHMDDVVPMVTTENGFVVDDGSKANAMYMADLVVTGAASSTVALTAEAHPITSIFSGTVTAYSNVAASITSTYVSTPGSGVKSLLQASDDATKQQLLLIDTGGTGLFNAPATPDYYVTMPARRVYLGMQCFQKAEPAAIYLLQRTVQWAIGDTVNAGDAPPPVNAAQHWQYE